MVMEAALKKAECDPKCGFMVQSHDEQEVINVITKHAMEKHGMKNYTVDDAKKLIVDA
jgi:predicted small metal-binding protein